MAFAALLESLAIVGSRKADGTVNASGRVWLYQPGTTTVQTVYSNADATATATNPATLDASGKATIYVRSPVRVLVQDSAGTTVSDTTYYTGTAESVGVANAGFTGINHTTLATEAGGDTNLNAVLTSAFASCGGVDFKYKESNGATARPFQSVVRGIQVSVKDFGAAGDGLADDTTAVQAAVNRVAALGGGIVYFDPGTYKVSAAITLSSKTGVNFLGAGNGVSVIRNTAAGSALSLTSCSSFTIEKLGITHSSSSAVGAIALAACNTFVVSNFSIVSHQIGVDISGAAVSNTAIVLPSITTTNNAASRGIRYNVSGLSPNHSIIGGRVATPGAVGYSVEYNGTVGQASVIGMLAWDTAGGSGGGILFNAALSGTLFSIVGCPALGSAGGGGIIINGANDPFISQSGNSVIGTTVDVASGGTATPNLALGPHLRIRGTSTGVAYVVAAPIPAAPQKFSDLVIEFFNNAGGAVTGWTLNAIYHTTGAISTTNLDHTMVWFKYDASLNVYREVSRAVTT